MCSSFVYVIASFVFCLAVLFKTAFFFICLIADRWAKRTAGTERWQPNVWSIQYSNIGLVKCQLLKWKWRSKYCSNNNVHEQQQAKYIPTDNQPWLHPVLHKTKVVHDGSRDAGNNIKISSFKGHDTWYGFMNKEQ